MAENKRKVLINRHSSKAYAPSASTMYLGEIAVSHPTDLNATTIYTKNDNVMVPFASCAMTMQMIDSKIKAADMDYEVVKGADEKYIKVETATTTTEDGKKTTFTLSTSNVASDTDLQALSSATESKFENMTNILSGLTDIVITGVTGDEAIKVASGETTTGASNTITLTHKAGHESNGFNKLTTDAYGHVTSSTAVSTSDIEGLGFKSSADTSKEIADAIKGLDAVSATTGKYFTAIGVKDGKLVKEEAELPKLSSATTGNGNVVTDIQVTDHEITFVKGMTVASDADLKAVSGIVDTFSAATVDKIASAFTYVDKKIDALDVAQISESGKSIVAISQTNGKIEAVAGDIAAAHVTVADAGNKLTATTVEGALAELADKAKAITITNTDKSINVTTSDTGTVIDVNIKSGENVLAKAGNGGLYTDIKLCGVTPTSTTVKEEYVLYATDGTELRDRIKIYKDSHIKSIEYITTPGAAHYQNLKYTYIDVNGVEKTEYVDISSLVLEAEFASGITVTNHVAHGVVASNSETFLTVGAEGFKLSGVQAAIDAAKASATTKVAKDVAATHLTLSSTTADDGSVTYTIGESDIASKAALDAEIAARKAVDGQDGQTYVANAGAKYISAASSLNDADVKLDAALKAEESARTSQDDKIEASIGLAENGSHVTTNGTYTSAATTVVGEIAALDSALKAVSDRVGKKLTFADDATDVEYDGSVDKTITFGSVVNDKDNRPIGRSLTITNGVVDVEIIDCGEY